MILQQLDEVMEGAGRDSIPDLTGEASTPEIERGV